MVYYVGLSSLLHIKLYILLDIELLKKNGTTILDFSKEIEFFKRSWNQINFFKIKLGRY